MERAKTVSTRLRFEVGERVPTVGETVIMVGFAGSYAVTIKRIKKAFAHEDGATLMDANIIKRLIVE